MLKDKDFLFNIFNEVDSMIFIIDEFKRVVEVSNNTFSMLGRKHHEIEEKPFSSLVIKDDRENTEKILQRMFEEDFKGEQEFFIITKESGTKLISCKYFVHRISNVPSTDDPAYGFYDDEYLVLIGKDVTNERMLEQTEKIEQEKFDGLFNNPGVAQAIIDMDMKYMEVNETFCNLLGYTHGELLELTPKNITYVKDIESVDYICNKLLDGGQDFVQIEKRYKKHNGFYFWALVTTTLQKTKNGEPLYFIQTIQDITEKKFFEEQARDNERKYKLLFHRSFNAIAYKKLIYDKKNRVVDYIILDANESYEKLTGLKRQDIINRPMRSKAQEHFRVTTNENMGRLKHYDKILKDGKDIHYTSQISRTTDKPVDVYYYILDKKESVFAVVFGEIDSGVIPL
jgi:PAS domain S-box-containing protein